MKLEGSQDYKLSKQHMVADMAELKSHFIVYVYFQIKPPQKNCKIVFTFFKSYFLTLSLCEH